MEKPKISATLVREFTRLPTMPETAKTGVVAQASGGIGVDRLNHAAKPHDKNQEQVL